MLIRDIDSLTVEFTFWDSHALNNTSLSPVSAIKPVSSLTKHHQLHTLSSLAPSDLFPIDRCQTKTQLRISPFYTIQEHPFLASLIMTRKVVQSAERQVVIARARIEQLETENHELRTALSKPPLQNKKHIAVHKSTPCSRKDSCGSEYSR